MPRCSPPPGASTLGGRPPDADRGEHRPAPLIGDDVEDRPRLGGHPPPSIVRSSGASGNGSTRLLVRPPQQHLAEKSLLKLGHRRPSAPAQPGDQQRLARIGQHGGLGDAAERPQGKPGGEKRGAAAEQHLAAARVGHRQPPPGVGVQADLPPAGAEPPWLGVMHRLSSYRRRDHVQPLFPSSAAVGGSSPASRAAGIGRLSMVPRGRDRRYSAGRDRPHRARRHQPTPSQGQCAGAKAGAAAGRWSAAAGQDEPEQEHQAGGFGRFDLRGERRAQCRANVGGRGLPTSTVGCATP